MAVGNAPANGQTDARSLIVIPPVQSLEHDENPVRIFLVKPDAIVVHTDLAELLGGRGLLAAGREALHEGGIGR